MVVYGLYLISNIDFSSVFRQERTEFQLVGGKPTMKT